jgi:hypothetical protein
LRHASIFSRPRPWERNNCDTEEAQLHLSLRLIAIRQMTYLAVGYFKHVVDSLIHGECGIGVAACFDTPIDSYPPA